MRKMGPLKADHPIVTAGDKCPACDEMFKEGEFVTLIEIGPGADPEEQERAREGRAYNAVALPAHWTCATGEP